MIVSVLIIPIQVIKKIQAISIVALKEYLDFSGNELIRFLG